MIHQQPEGLAADPALADRLVAVDPRPKLPLGIVGVNHHQSLQPDVPVEAVQRVVERLGRGERIAGCEHVAGVEADAGPLLQPWQRVDHIEHGADLFEGGAQAGSLTRGGFDQDSGGESRGCAERLGDARGRPGHGDIHGLLARRAGMGHHPWDAEQFGAAEFLGETVDGFAAERRVGRCGIDEIGVVGHDES